MAHQALELVPRQIHDPKALYQLASLMDAWAELKKMRMDFIGFKIKRDVVRETL